jgi:hypothetical protein
LGVTGVSNSIQYLTVKFKILEVIAHAAKIGFNSGSPKDGGPGDKAIHLKTYLCQEN